MNNGSNSLKCINNYISISSKNKPKEIFKLCGNQRAKKFITNYNDVLINLITDSLTSFSAGFSLIYKVITDTASCELIKLLTVLFW